MQILTIELEVAFVGIRGFMSRPVQNPVWQWSSRQISLARI